MKKVAFTETFGGRRWRAEEACGDCSARGTLTPHHPPATPPLPVLPQRSYDREPSAGSRQDPVGAVCDDSADWPQSPHPASGSEDSYSAAQSGSEQLKRCAQYSCHLISHATAA